MGQIKLRKAYKSALNHMYYDYGRGVSKHAVDASDGIQRIHSQETYNTYLKQANKYADWCYAHGCRYDVQLARDLVPQYLQELIDSGISAWTVRTAAAALAKIYSCSSVDFGVQFPKRERLAVKRSRYAAERDRHVSLTANELLITTARCTGLRRHELEELRGTDLIKAEDGQCYVRVGKAAKGGRPRQALIVASEKELRMIVKAMDQAGKGKVFEHVHSKLDVHALRSQYACSVYRRYARPLETLSKKEQYCCRKDMIGHVYDRQAMQVASRMLGHNRIDVIANNYLYNL